jgi:hypothetical protein
MVHTDSYDIGVSVIKALETLLFPGFSPSAIKYPLAVLWGVRPGRSRLGKG